MSRKRRDRRRARERCARFLEARETAGLLSGDIVREVRNGWSYEARKLWPDERVLYEQGNKIPVEGADVDVRVSCSWTMSAKITGPAHEP